MKYNKWFLEQKLEIMSSSEEIGVVWSCRKYGVITSTFYSWKRKFDHKGAAEIVPNTVIQSYLPSVDRCF